MASDEVTSSDPVQRLVSERIEVTALGGVGSLGLFTRPVRPAAELVFINPTDQAVTFTFTAQSPLSDSSSVIALAAGEEESRTVASGAGGEFPLEVVSGQGTSQETKLPLLLDVRPNGISKLSYRVDQVAPLEVTIRVHAPRAQSVEVTFLNSLVGSTADLSILAKLLSDRRFGLRLSEPGLLPPFVLSGTDSGVLLRAELEDFVPGTQQNGGGQFVEIVIDP